MLGENWTNDPWIWIAWGIPLASLVSALVVVFLIAFLSEPGSDRRLRM